MLSLLSLLSRLAHAFDQLFQVGNKLCLKNKRLLILIDNFNFMSAWSFRLVWYQSAKYSYLGVLIRGTSFKSLLYRAHHLNLSLDKFPDLYIIITVFLTAIIFNIHFTYSRFTLKEFLSFDLIFVNLVASGLPGCWTCQRSSGSPSAWLPPYIEKKIVWLPPLIDKNSMVASLSWQK